MKRALLIGINAYNRLQRVSFAKDDAEAVSEVLQDVYSFQRDEIVLMTDQRPGIFTPTQNNIEEQILALRRLPLDFLLFGFWGHGSIDDQLKRYLCVQDTSTDTGRLQRTAISLDFVLDVLKQVAAPQTCVLLDCCQNIAAARGETPAVLTECDCNLFDQGARDIVTASQSKRHANPDSNPVVPTTIIMNSCSKTQRAFEWSDRHHGIFTAHLLDAMNATPSVSQWARHVSEQVPLTAISYGHTQIPHVSIDGGADVQIPGFQKSNSNKNSAAEIVISEDPNQVQVREYKVGEIQIKFEKITSSSEAAPTSEKVVLPPVSAELRELQGELAGLDKLLEEVAAETASVLKPAQDSVESARQQRDKIAERQSEFWKKLNPSDEDRRRLATVVNDQMDLTVSPLSLCSGKPDAMAMPDFVRLVLWGQKKTQSEAIVRKTEDEYKQKRTELIENLNRQKKDKLALQARAAASFYKQAIDLILAVCPGHAAVESPVPYEELLPLLPLLDQYRLGCSDVEIWKMAENRWLENRPCVIKATSERLEREREKTEQERQRPAQLCKSGLGDQAGERQVVTISGVQYAFRWCPPGTFPMGSPASEKSRFYNETQHEVTLTKGFWMLETPVTQLMWQSVMGKNPSYFKGDNLPVEHVSSNDCQEFIGKLNNLFKSSLRFRFPTEAEWEYACRAGTETPFSFGNTLNGTEANCNGNYPYGTETKGPYLERTTPVNRYAPNAWGLYDMHGNVKEWCFDWFDLAYYADSPSSDPTGPNSGAYRVARGGDCLSSAKLCRCAYRYIADPTNRYSYVGLRVLLDPFGR